MSVTLWNQSALNGIQSKTYGGLPFTSSSSSALGQTLFIFPGISIGLIQWREVIKVFMVQTSCSNAMVLRCFPEVLVLKKVPVEST